MRPIPQIAVDFIKGAEACRLNPYLDGGGTPTVGWGHTGYGVRLGEPWALVMCGVALGDDLNHAAARLATCVDAEHIAALSDHQYAALISFVFNLGADPKWTIWKLLNAGQLDGVPAQMKRFDKEHEGGVLVVVPGLDHRRLAEVTLWETADVGAALTVMAAAPTPPPPSSETRTAATPPTPIPTQPLVKSKSFMTSGLTAIVASASAALPLAQGASGGITQVHDALAPYADTAPIIGQIQKGLMITLAALAVAVVVLIWIRHVQVKAA